MKEIVEKIGAMAIRNKQKLAVAESCTGGWIAQELTAIAGSSEWFDCGFVTYSNDAKQRMLGVSGVTLQRYGAVSSEVVSEMAEGVIIQSDVGFSVATSGVAGPGGGSEEKPVGTVWFAWAVKGKPTEVLKFRFDGDRESVRKQAVRVALGGILKNLSA